MTNKEFTELQEEVSLLLCEVERIKGNPLFRLTKTQRQKLHRQIERTIKGVLDRHQKLQAASLNKCIEDFNKQVKEYDKMLADKMKEINTLIVSARLLVSELGQGKPVDAIGKKEG